MIVGPLKMHGGKSYLADRIVDLMPKHLHYCEPYFGGGSVLLAKDPEGVSEVANDLDGELTNFWHVLKNDETFESFKRIVEATPFSEPAWERAGTDWTYSPPVWRAWGFFVRCRQSLAGRMDTFAPLSRTRTRRGMNEQASAWISAVDGLPEVHSRLRRVVILNRPALEVIWEQDGPDTLFYCDPPYLHETRSTTTEYGPHEMSEDDHDFLLDTLAMIKGKFLLSGYRSKLYDSRAEIFGWTRHDFEISNHASGAKEKRRMTECVWTNF